MLSTCCYARHGRYKIYHTIWWNLRFLKLLSTDTWHRCFWGIITVSSQDHDLTFTNSSRTFSKTRISNWQKLTVLPSLYFIKNCWWQIIVVVKFQAMKWTRPDHKSKWSQSEVGRWNIEIHRADSVTGTVMLQHSSSWWTLMENITPFPLQD